MGKLTGRIAIVTGAARASARGSRFSMPMKAPMSRSSTRTPSGAADDRGRDRSAGGAASRVTADVGDEAAVTKAFDEILGQFGAPDILVNNAGIATVSLLENMSAAMWDEMIRVNLKSVFLCTRAVLPGHAPEALRPHHQYQLAART